MELQQIFEYAIDQETKAKDFYEKSAASIDNSAASSLFRSLAKMEAGHKRALESELNVLTQTGEVRQIKRHQVTPQEEMLASLHRVAQVLREANVELETRQKRFESELRMAGEIQINLLPKTVPQLEGLDIAVACFMASHVGGDYYDFLIDATGNLNLTIGDVAGKGMPAALLMVAIRTLWRSIVRAGFGPERVTELLSEDLASEFTESDQFVTMITGVYNSIEETLYFSNAGHWPPLYLPANSNQFEIYPPGHVPIGIDMETRYKLFDVHLSRGDIFAMFSDGLVEARNPSKEFYEDDRLAKVILENRDLPAETIREKIMHAVEKFAGTHRQDDQTLVILKKTK